MQKCKRIGDNNTNKKNIQSGCRDRIIHRKMCHANNEKQKTTNNGWNRSNKSRKNQNALRKGNLQMLGNIGSGHHQISGDERIIKNEYLRRTRKAFETKQDSKNLIKGINTWAVHICKILMTILETYEGRTSTNRQENNNINNDASGLTSER